jgi:hypothetical protein
VSNALATTCSHVPQGTVLLTYTNAHHFNVLLFQVSESLDVTGRATTFSHAHALCVPTLSCNSARWLLTRALGACWAAR